MSYEMKKSPINKGYASKPSPAKLAPVILGAIYGGLASGVVGAGSAAIQGAAARKAAKKQSQSQAKSEARQNITTSMHGKVGGGSRLID